MTTESTEDKLIERVVLLAKELAVAEDHLRPPEGARVRPPPQRGQQVAPEGKSLASDLRKALHDAFNYCDAIPRSPMSGIAERFLGDTPLPEKDEKDKKAEKKGYPTSPGYKADGTSKAAAEVVGASITGRRGEILRVFREAFPDGLTSDQAAEKLGRSVLAVRPRVSELGKHFGMLELTGEQRNNVSGLSADVWRFKEGP